jgi:hypothetical protein
VENRYVICMYTRVGAGQVEPNGAGGSVWLSRIACSWVYAERTPMLSIGVI